MTNRRIEEQLQADRVLERYEGVASLLQGLDIDEFWGEATEVERRALVDELVEMVVVHPDHLEVEIAGAPKLNVLLSEVGLKDSGNTRVGGGT